jgi:hypothetical protein
MAKMFRLSADQIRQIVTNQGGCIASDMITVEGRKVGWMYRETPDFKNDSGWRFFAGIESDEYMQNPANHAIYDVNTIANYDEEIVPHLSAPIGSAFERSGLRKKFRAVEDWDLSAE